MVNTSAWKERQATLFPGAGNNHYGINSEQVNVYLVTLSKGQVHSGDLWLNKIESVFRYCNFNIIMPLLFSQSMLIFHGYHSLLLTYIEARHNSIIKARINRADYTICYYD